jgi:hypothetical protein
VTSNNHVEAEVLAAWSEGRLPADESTRVDAHLASCDDCQKMLAVFARTAPPAVVSGVTRTWHLRWAIPIAAAATVAAIWVAIPADKRTAELQHNDAFSVPPSSTSGGATKPETPISAEAPQSVESPQERPRQDASAPPALADRVEQEKSADASAQRQAPRAVAKERDQDLKAEAAAAAAPAAPPRAQDQNRLRVEERASLLRQSGVAEVVSPDPLVRWRIQAPGRLERSLDAGKTWDAVTLPQQLTVTTVQAPTAVTAIVTAADGRQWRTDDQGKTWNPVQP